MAWSDEPTDMQLGIIYSWLVWKVDRETAKDAVKWLETSATRKDVSVEMNRLKILKDEHKLTEENCFDSEIWEGFKNDRS